MCRRYEQHPHDEGQIERRWMKTPTGEYDPNLVSPDYRTADAAQVVLHTLCSCKTQQSALASSCIAMSLEDIHLLRYAAAAPRVGPLASEDPQSPAYHRGSGQVCPATVRLTSVDAHQAPVTEQADRARRKVPVCKLML